VGFIGDVVEFTRSIVDGQQAPEARVDRGGDDAVTAYHFTCPGDDSFPLPGDVAYLGEDQGTGNAQIVGYQDPLSSPVATAGEKRIYSRRGPGVSACEVYLQSDGTLILKNDLGSIELDAAGNVTISSPLGTYGATTHFHSTPFGPSGPPIPGT